ncbi:MAG: DUF2264 domain-containing protein [Nibricoccus sp.]
MPTLPFQNNPLRTRADVQQLLRDLVNPILPHFSKGRAEVHLGETRASYGDPAGWLEGFARPLWGLIPLAAGNGDFKHWSLWREGLDSGTNPTHQEYWGLAGDFDQRSVEQAAIGFGLALAPKTIWEPLSSDTKKRLSAWLQHINDVKLVQSNWLFFRVLVNLGLRRCGEPWSQDRINADLDQLDQFYLGEGWYSDGKTYPPAFRDGRLGDYYIPMAFHLYGLIYARLASDFDPTRCARIVERARAFSRDFVYWFSADGSALPFGRSLTYRFAQGSFWGGLAFAAVEASPWGVIKGLYLRHLRWWMQQPICSETGLLTIGYAYPNLHMAESYNSPDSPYWALKAFLPLALPDAHPFWRANEEPLPRRQAVHTIPNANMIIATDPARREITALTPGQPVYDWPRNAPHKYSKCAYSTRFGFNVPAGAPTLAEGGLDNGISVSDNNRLFRVREHCEGSVLKDGAAYSRWQPWPDVEIHTWIIASPTAHVRIHRITTARKIWIIDGGFPVVYTRKSTLSLQTPAETNAAVRGPSGASFMQSLFGKQKAECAELGANSSLMASLSAMPLLRSALEPDAQPQWIASYVAGSGNRDDHFEDAAKFSVQIDGASLRLLKDSGIWWSATDYTTGTSAPERLAELAQQV